MMKTKNLLGRTGWFLKKKKVKIVPIDGFELRNCFRWNKTKIGKDFYDLYYYLYNDYKINSKEIVVIIEEFSSSKYKNNDKHKQWVVYEF
jgi:hypothetical protein